MRGRKNQPEDFWARVDRSGGPDACWPYMGTRTPRGYGVFSMGGKQYRANRLAWLLTKGPISPKVLICHHCDNPPCCNSRHFFRGTPAMNQIDRKRKGRLVSDQHWSHLHPERRATGAQHGRHTQPERSARGLRHGQHGGPVTTEQRDAIRLTYAQGYRTQRSLATEYEIGQTTVSLIVRGITPQLEVVA